MPSVNDNFANAIEVTIATNGGTHTSSSLANTGNTVETNEPVGTEARSMWFKYTPTSSGTASFDTQLSTPIGTSTDTYMTVFTGTALANLVSVGTDDDGGGSGTSLISGLAVTAGTTYWVQVGGYGNTELNVRLRATGPATTGGGSPTTGTLSASVPRARSTIAGTAAAPTFPATLTASIPPTRSTITGTATAPSGAGTLSSSLPRITGTLAGTVVAPTWTGTLDATLPPPAGSVTGTTASPAGTGFLAATLPRLTSSLTGVVQVDDALVPPSARIHAAEVRAPSANGSVRGSTAAGTLRTPTTLGRLR